MSEWRDYSLGELINVKHGYAFPGEFITPEATPNVLVTPGNFYIGGGFKQDKFKYFSGNYPVSYLLKEGDIVVTMTDLSQETDTLGFSAKIPNKKGIKFLHNQRIGLLEFISEDADKDFIYWLLRTNEYQGFIVGASSGTSIRHTSPKFIKEYKFKLPSPKEQKAIASVLSSLDDKIDLLHRQNTTLERMAETLFRQWFVEEAQEDWEVKPLSFYGEIICGKTPSKQNHGYFNGDVPFIKIPDMHGNAFIFKTEDSLTELGKNSQNNKTIPALSICVSCIATVGLVSLATKPSQTNQQINSIIPKHVKYRYFLYLTMKESYDLLHAEASGGTATLNLNTGNFSRIAIALPPENLLLEFHSIIERVFNKIYQNQSQIQTLEKLRNNLLPKLMSGEVRVMIENEEQAA